MSRDQIEAQIRAWAATVPSLQGVEPEIIWGTDRVDIEWELREPDAEIATNDLRDLEWRTGLVHTRVHVEAETGLCVTILAREPM
jgi:hypothetical protein